jgi:hypothetical protein
MTTQRDPGVTDPATAGGPGGHGWMMIACSIPMLVIAIVLVATGVASISFLFTAIACTVMMAMMMRGMGHGGGRS